MNGNRQFYNILILPLSSPFQLVVVTIGTQIVFSMGPIKNPLENKFLFQQVINPFRFRLKILSCLLLAVIQILINFQRLCYTVWVCQAHAGNQVVVYKIVPFSSLCYSSLVLFSAWAALCYLEKIRDHALQISPKFPSCFTTPRCPFSWCLWPESQNS